ncbi:MAG: glycosyltransferase family 39 protein [Candidatus Aenigmatarchaeota archaeon]
MAEKEIVIEVKYLEIIFLLMISLAVLALNLQVSLNSPIVFGDEGFHSRLAQWIAEKREYPIYFDKIEGSEALASGYARPPLWNLLEASLFLIFGFHEIIIKLFTPFLAFLTGISTYLLVKKLSNSRIALFSSIISVTVPSFVTYSVLFYTDILFTFYSSLFFFTFLLFKKTNSKKYLLLSGIFASLATLTKAPGYAYYLFFLLAFLYDFIKKRNFFENIKNYLVLILILLIISAGLYIRNYHYYSNPICYSIPHINIFPMENCSLDKFEEKYTFTSRAEMTGTEQSVYSIGIVSYLDFAYGSLAFVFLSFAIGIFVLYEERNEIFPYIALFFLVFLAIFYISTGRAEDTARYTLAWVPSIALISSIFFEKIYNFLSLYHKYLGLIIFILVILISFYNLNNKLEVMGLVKQFSPSFFEACEWVKQNPDKVPKDAILMTIWNHRAIYNCQRNSHGIIADIALSKDLNYTLEVAKKLGITHIFIQKFSIDLQNRHLGERYDAEFVQFLEANPEHFEKIYENGPSLQDCFTRGYCDGNIIYKIKY